ncbi:hypothetical protein DB346_12830 [Verrucomicrobia bacterium LW23]|nr:hypothetical protein DB346_12830 [Verrucomicrobia bacterium LW23]
MAIVVVLLFVVLLSGIVMAFLIRSASQKKIAENSAEQIKVDLFGRGMAVITVGDLRQEIVDGSAPAATFTDNSMLYMPLGSTNAVPQRVGTDNALPNLVKRSASGVKMYEFAGKDGPDRASSVSTETVSLNGRSMTKERWNRAYLLPKQTPEDGTTAVPLAQFASPDWIYVARDGSNPKTWAPGMEVKGTNPILGRYAFTIYDEGGLLDANVAGYPGGPNGSTQEQICSKAGVPYADLTQVLGNGPGGAGFSPARSQDLVNQLVGWRNFATLKPVGSLPSFTYTAGTGDAYFNFVRSNGKGYLAAGNTALYDSQSDRAFASRQELIKFLLQSMATNADERAKMQYALQFLGTFTRDINQPSYAPEAGRPLIKGNSANGGNSAYSGDNIINPSFLMDVRVASPFTRNDGTTAVAGEPLVKQRFALARLAWITYAGPSASRNMAPSSTVGNPDYDIWLLLNKHGVTSDFLRQGTPENIYKYFGLSWVPDPNNPGSFAWIYKHEGTSPLASAAAVSPNPIRTLKAGTSVVTGREPDFFELLKATVNVGSIAKAYGSSTDTLANYNGNWQMRMYATTRDADVDAAIVQLGANILSQSSTSGYSVRIFFHNNLFGKIQEYRGVQDMPYINRVREGKVVQKHPAGQGFTTINALPITGTVVTDPGRGIALQEPEIWNPHAWNASRADTMPRPTAFRVIAVTEDPNGNALADITVASGWRGMSGFFSSNTFAAQMPVPVKLTPATTEMLFDIRQTPSSCNHLFREPTMLVKPGVPTNSNLRVGPQHPLLTILGTGYARSVFNNYFMYVGNGLGTTAADNQQYIGVVIAPNMPMAYTADVKAGDFYGSPAADGPAILPAGFSTLVSGSGITYRLQYKDPAGNWITYDEKFAPLCIAFSYDDPRSGGRGNTFASGRQCIGSELAVTCVDPRTARFGMQHVGRAGLRGSLYLDYPLPDATYPASYDIAGRTGWARTVQAPGPGWANISHVAAQNAVWTNRPDINPGYLFSTGNSAVGVWSINAGPTGKGWYPGGLTSFFPPGMLTQNNPAVAVTATNPVQLRFLCDYTTGNLQPTGLRAFADPDGVFRRGMSAYVRPTPTSVAQNGPAGSASGLPLKVAYNFSTTGSGTITDAGESNSRPIILNRPFRSVAELGYVFSGTPWRNIDFFTPESGNAAMLDVFCINPSDDPDGLTAGKINLNTRQPLVLKAILANGYMDEFVPASASTCIAANGTVSADTIAAGLVARTTDTSAGAGPLANVSQLVGKWNSSQTVASATAPFNIDGGASYTGFSGTTATATAPPATPVTLSKLLTADTSASAHTAAVNQRYRESTIRALSNAGQTRVWNLMIDMVAQVGGCPAGTSSLANFNVKGERRYWIHVAIDRYTGAVLDEQIEVVQE